MLRKCRFKFVQIMVPGGRMGPQLGDQVLHRNIQRKSLKIFFSKTTRPGKLNFEWKHRQVVQIQVCLNHGPRGQGGATIGGSGFTQEYIQRKSLKILFSKTIRPDRLKLKWKHPQVVQILDCSNHGPRGQGWATVGGSSFTQEYIEKICKLSSQKL